MSSLIALLTLALVICTDSAPTATISSGAIVGTTTFVVRSYGAIWGISIPSAIFNTQFGKLAHRISDPSVRAHSAQGAAYSTVSKAYMSSLAPQVESEVISVYSDSLKLVWQVAIAFSGFSFLLVFLEKELKLRDELETEYGLKEPTKSGPKKMEDGDASH